MKNRPPDLHLEEARNGERDIDEAFVADVFALRADDAAFLARDPARLAAARVRALAEARAPATNAAAHWWAPLASAAALALWVALPTTTTTTTTTTTNATTPTKTAATTTADVITDKGGGAVLTAARVVGDDLVDLDDGDAASAGDVIQLGWLLPGAASSSTHAVVVSIDGRGAVTTHLRDRRRGAALSTSRGALPDSYVLDDAPRFERFFLVAGADVDADDVVARATRFAARRDADVAAFPAPADAVVSSLLLRKVP